MAALHEKFLWPLIGVVIFAVLAAFYIDDRRKLSQENTNAVASQEARTEASSTPNKPSEDKASEPVYASNQETKKSANSATSTHASNESKTSNSTATDSSVAGHEGFSGSINDYLAQSSSKRSAELEAAAANHQGFSGSIEDYLSGGKSNQVIASQQPSKDSSTTTSVSKDEYLAKAEGKASQNKNGQQSLVPKNESDPFQTKQHMGFHGSYEEYAKKYN